MKVVKSVMANMYILKEDEGGRKKPFSNGYRPQLYCRTADVAAEITLPEGMAVALPGDSILCKLTLHFPLPLITGIRFALREGGRTIAAGVITEIHELEEEK